MAVRTAGNGEHLCCPGRIPATGPGNPEGRGGRGGGGTWGRGPTKATGFMSFTRSSFPSDFSSGAESLSWQTPVGTRGLSLRPDSRTWDLSLKGRRKQRQLTEWPLRPEDQDPPLLRGRRSGEEWTPGTQVVTLRPCSIVPFQAQHISQWDWPGPPAPLSSWETLWVQGVSLLVPCRVSLGLSFLQGQGSVSPSKVKCTETGAWGVGRCGV